MSKIITDALKSILLVTILCFSVSCGKKQDTQTTNQSTVNSENTSERTIQPDTFSSSRGNADEKIINSPAVGSYTGGFEASVFDETKNYVYENRITVFIDSLSKEIIYGHSVVAGNNRFFKGAYKTVGGKITAETSEPGDDKYDGKFYFEIDTEKGNLKGTWKANDKKLDVSERKYSLDKKQFKYDASLNLPEDVQWSELYDANPKFPDKFETLTADVTKYNASVKELTGKDVENLYKGDLEIIRNAIYARHGYSFKSRRVRFVFDRYAPWYMPVSTDVRNELTEVEKKNIELLKRFEDHAEKYYDEYGR